MSRSFEVTMQGRIIALELFMRNLLADRIGAIGGDPVADAEAFKTSFLASLQNLSRSIDDYSDEVWAAAADAARANLDNVIHRIRQQSKRPGGAG